jgi:hypothetical protein
MGEDELINDRKFSLSFLKEMHNMLTGFYREKRGIDRTGNFCSAGIFPHT